MNNMSNKIMNLDSQWEHLPVYLFQAQARGEQVWTMSCHAEAHP